MGYRDYSVAKAFIVDSSGHGDFTSINSAVAAAAAVGVGDVFVRPGGYTENITLQPNVNITGFSGDEGDFHAANVVITGKMTFTPPNTASGVAISNVLLLTNSDFVLVVNGTQSAHLDLNNCYIDCNNNSGISVTNSNAGTRVMLTGCSGNLLSSSFAYISSSGAGSVVLNDCDFSESGPSSTANTFSAGSVLINGCKFLNPITTSSTAALTMQFSSIDTSASNVTGLTVGGSGTNYCDHSIVHSGTASAISVGSTLTAVQLEINSSNTHAITGAGTLNYGVITFSGSSSNINTSTLNPLVTLPVDASSITINGDSGSATGGTISFLATPNSGSSVAFVASGSTVNLDVTDANLNTIIGSGAGNGSISGSTNTGLGRLSLSSLTSGIDNTCIGYATGNAVASGSSNVAVGSTALVVATGGGNTALGTATCHSLTSGANNIAIGNSCLFSLLTGTFNIVMGQNSGSNYTGAESSNIIIGNTGTASESNVIRIGTTGTGDQLQNKCFVAGIAGVSVSNAQYVTINTSTGQLGSTGQSRTWTDENTSFSAAANQGYFVTGTATAALPASPSQGDTIEFIVDTTNILTITANTGQVIRIGSAVSAAAGTAASNARGDSAVLVYRSSDTAWIAKSVIGTWTVT